MKKRIALLFGGESSEHEVSVMGYQYMRSLLTETIYDILPVYIDRCGKWLVGGTDGVDAHLTARGGVDTDYGFIGIDAAIPLLHGEGGEDGSLQGALDKAGIPYVGADVLTSAVCTDKFYTQSVAASLGIPTVKSVIFSRATDTESAYRLCLDRLGLPLFVKPRRLGSSIGAYPVYDRTDFFDCFPKAMEKGGGLVTAEMLVREKRELECAFCEAGGRRLITPPGEVLVDGFYGYSEKYGGETKVLPRADVDTEVGERIVKYSEMLADALSLRHLARIDFFLSGEEVLFNEVNTFPGFTRESLYPKMLEAAGISVREAILSFIGDALGC